MKLIKLAIILTITLCFSISGLSSSKTKQITVAEDLAKIAHDMAYGKTTNESKFFIDGGVLEKNAFKASYGNLESNPKVVVLVFRGTLPTAFSNIKADVKTKLVPLTSKTFKPCANCLVHEGFSTAYKEQLRTELREKFSPFILNKLKAKEIDTVYFVGHSLGGALATLAAYDSGVYLANEKITGLKLGLVTFGAPRVGNADFAKYMNEGLGLITNLRITFKDDPIISVPYEDTYVHCGSEYHFTSTEMYGTGPKNVDNTARAKGAWDTIKKIVTDIADHSGYSSINDKKIVEIIKGAPTKKLKKLK
jgi:predicted lipase